MQPGLRTSSIVLAACETVEEAFAIVRYVLPILEEWPRSAWSTWVTDARSYRVRAANVEAGAAGLCWQDVNDREFFGNELVSDVLGDRAGIVVLADQTIARKIASNFHGLVADLCCISSADPAAQSIERPLAALSPAAEM